MAVILEEYFKELVMREKIEKEKEEQFLREQKEINHHLAASKVLNIRR